MAIAPHQQTWVKVNAQVDTGIAELVSLLNKVPGLETLQSCQGLPGESPAYIYFHCGEWEEVCRFAFSVLAPRLPQIEEVSVLVETFAGSRPIRSQLAAI